MAGTLITTTIQGTTLTDGTNSTSVTNCIKGSAKAWVNVSFTGAVSTIRGSYNVSSVTRTGTGTGYASLTSAMPNANYAVVCGGSENNTTGTARFATAWVTSASQFDFACSNFIGGITYADAATYSFGVLSS